MAIYSCNISNVSRGRGSSACAAAAYITAQKMRDDRTGDVYDYGRTDRVCAVETILPQGAPAAYSNPETLFNAVENYETAANARTAKKIMVALPREFDLPTQKAVVESFIRQNITAQGYACTYAIHTDKENNNPHAHILIANRQINTDGEWSTKSRKEYALDENGERIPLLDKNGQQKIGKRNERLWKRVSVRVNPLDKAETLAQIREQWAIECNKHLTPDLQIDHRSYADQGRKEVPTIHEGYAARKVESAGGVSEICEQNRQIRQHNAVLQALQKGITEMAGQAAEILREWRDSIYARIGGAIKRRESSRVARGVGAGERGASGTNIDYAIRQAAATIDYSRSAEAHSGADRQNRNAERERQRIAAEQERTRAEQQATGASQINRAESAEFEM